MEKLVAAAAMMLLYMQAVDSIRVQMPPCEMGRGCENSCPNKCLSQHNSTQWFCVKGDKERETCCECEKPCDATQTCYGDPACINSEGRFYWAHGIGRFLLAQSHPAKDPAGFLQPYKVYGVFRSPCPREGMCYSSVTSVELDVFGHTFNLTGLPFELPFAWRLWKKPAIVQVDGLVITELPYEFNNYDKKLNRLEKVLIYRKGNWIHIESSVGIMMRYYFYYVHLHTPLTKQFINNVDGLMGRLQKDRTDPYDFSYPNGTLSTTPVHHSFWPDTVGMVAELNPKGNNSPKPKAECNGKVGAAARKFCQGYFDVDNNQNPFQKCLQATPALADMASGYLDQCEFDVCEMGVESTMSGAYCELLDEVQKKCAANNVNVKAWRSKKFCDAVCPEDPKAEWVDCVKPEVETCATVKNPGKKPKSEASTELPCVSGCECQKNHVRDSVTGKCVHRNRC